MSIKHEEKLKEFRKSLEAELERLSKMEKDKVIKEKLENIKMLLKLPNEELEKIIDKDIEKNNKNKGLTDEELDNVSGGGDAEILDEWGLRKCYICDAIYPKDYPHRCTWFKCPYCGEDYANEVYYSIHLKAVHNKPYMCEWCNKPFGNFKEYDEHRKNCAQRRN